jgi:hypothetical protein
MDTSRGSATGRTAVSIHYVKNAVLPADWGGDLAEIEGRFGE